MRVIRAVLLGLLAAFALLIGASQAWAHANLITSDPGNGDVLAEAPRQVSLTFSEPVTLGAGYLQVIDIDGERVDTGNVTINGEIASVPLIDDLPDGGYIISYRIISADSHPVSGGVSFAVGDAAPPNMDSPGALIVDTSEDPVISVLYPAVRWIGYAGLALMAGVLLMALLDPALRSQPGSRRLSWLGFDLALGATVAGGLLQGPYAAGREITSIVDLALISTTLQTPVGRMAALRLLLLGILGVLLWEWFAARRERRAITYSAAGAVVAIALTYASSGHATTGQDPLLSVTLTALHLAAAAAWTGGLIVLLVIVIGRRSTWKPAEQDALVRRFSPIAGWLVAVMIAGGVIQAWLLVGSVEALLATTFGRLLLGKSALLALALIAALLARNALYRRAAAAGNADEVPAETAGMPRLRRAILTEAVAGGAAIALAAVLVATPPAKDIYSVARDTTITFDNNYLAQLNLDPGRSGANTLHLYLFDRDSALSAVEQVAVTLENVEAKIGPLDVDAQRVGQGHFIASGVQLPADGTWIINVTFTEEGFGTVSEQGTIDVG